MKDDEYLSLIQEALLAFQMIEEGLKIYIQGSYEIKSFTSPDGEDDYEKELKNINNTPLGPLIKKYLAFSKNENLANDLKEITEWRNFCAHNAYAHEFLKRNCSSNYTDHSPEDLRKVIAFSKSLSVRLGGEIIKLKEVHASVSI